MNHRQTRGRIAALGTTLVVAVTVAACGGSSPSSTTSTTSSTANVNANVPGATGSSGRTALAACLKRYGVSLPGGAFAGRGRFGATGASGRLGAGGGFFGATGASGRRGSFFGATGASGRRGSFVGATGASGRRGFPGGAFASNPKLATAFEKCRGLAGFPGGGLGGGRLGATSPGALGGASVRAQLAKFVTCMKGKGVHLPTPNLSGSGSVFGTGVNTASSTFRAAFAGCENTLPAFLRRAGGTPPAA
jgi:hypothetical protein